MMGLLLQKGKAEGVPWCMACVDQGVKDSESIADKFSMSMTGKHEARLFPHGLFRKPHAGKTVDKRALAQR